MLQRTSRTFCTAGEQQPQTTALAESNRMSPQPRCLPGRSSLSQLIMAVGLERNRFLLRQGGAGWCVYGRVTTQQRCKAGRGVQVVGMAHPPSTTAHQPSAACTHILPTAASTSVPLAAARAAALAHL